MAVKKGAKLYHFSGEVKDEDGKLEDGEKVSVLSDSEVITEGTEIIVTRVGDEGLEANETFSGDITTEDALLVVEDGKVIEVSKTEEVELETEDPKTNPEEDPKTDPEELELETEVPNTGAALDVEAVTAAVLEKLTPLVNEKFEALGKQLAELKLEMSEREADESSEEYAFTKQSAKTKKVPSLWGKE